MSHIDWAVMLGTLFFIVLYGTWKSRGSKDIRSYLLADKEASWWTIGLSVMATQASAITFLSTPGQGYADGMRFVQFYFGLPIAMVLICIFFIPLYYRLKVFTAYEFLESRFDRKTRVFTAFLFLVQRGLAAGITIYAPAIILSQILGWSLNFTILFIGILVIVYTVSGGTRAVSQTHKQQMAVIFAGMVIAFSILVYYLNKDLNFGTSWQIAGKLGKLNIIDTEFDPNNRYNIWSGIIGGLFLQLSYFGTDQSQVQRYLSGTSIKESRLGLLFNGMIKIPMQFFILLCGVMVFVFYQFNLSPIHFNQVALSKATAHNPAMMAELNNDYEDNFKRKKGLMINLADAIDSKNEDQINELTGQISQLESEASGIRSRVVEAIQAADPESETDDEDYIFISWIMQFLPVGLVGLLLAVIFSAAMSSTSAELNALASTMTVDIYKRNFKKEASEIHYLNASKWFTFLFGVLAICFAVVSSFFENLIEAVNILGSLFYGTILGVFIAAFFVKFIKARAVFVAAILAEIAVICVYQFTEIGYLWLNMIGCALVVLIASIIQITIPGNKKALE